jgi:hypothetical protein
MTDWAEFKYLDFAEGASTMTVTVKGRGRIAFRAEGTDILGSVEFDTDSPREFTAEIATLAGRCPLWLFLDGEFTLYGLRAGE